MKFVRKKTSESQRYIKRLALARLISISGSMSASIALSGALWHETRSFTWLAIAQLGVWTVAGLAAPIAGMVADHFDRKRIMIFSDISVATCYVLLAICVALDAGPWAYVLFATLAAICDTPFSASSRASVPNIADEEDLAWANGVLGRVSGLAFAMGPLFGGALLFVSPVVAFLANAASNLVEAYLVRSIKRPFSNHDTSLPLRMREKGAVRAGFAFVSKDRILRAVIFSGFIAFVGVGFINVSNPALAEKFGSGTLGLGLFWTGWGLGAVAGSWISGKYMKKGAEVRMAVAGFGLQSTAVTIIYFLGNFITVVPAMALGGLGMGITGPARETLIQRRTPDKLRGRVFAAMEATGNLSFAISFVSAGLFVSKVGLKNSYLLAGGLFFVGTFLMILLAGKQALLASDTKK